MEDLKFTAKGVAFVEKTAGKPLNAMITSFEVSSLVLFLQQGLRLTTTEEAYKKFDELLESGEYTTELIWYEVYNKLVEAHFLSPLPNQEELKQIADETRKNLITSGKDGKTAKP